MKTPQNWPLYQRARAGHTPAEALTQHDRHCLVAELAAHGWTDDRIAAHTRMTRYTTTRIRKTIQLADIP